MPSLELAAGTLRVTYPKSYQVPPPRSAVDHRKESPASLLDALTSQHMSLVAPFELVPVTQAGLAERPGARSSRAAKVRVALDLPDGQDAAILLEQDGLFSWQLPFHKAPGRAGSAMSKVRFELDVRPVRPAPSSRAGSTGRAGSAAAPPARVLGPFGDFVIGRVKGWVLKFAARLVPGAVMRFLERHTHAGLVLMTGPDMTNWPLLDNLSQITLPERRSARILLFIHGTFSSTVGSFGMLTSTAEGQKLLKAAAGAYDAVIGFDHRTLSRDPLENAIDLQARLRTGQLPFPPRIDIVSYSRGALVARSLIEYLLPSSTAPADIGKVVFVGGTNAGTLLAQPDNWADLLDLYTNLATVAARSIEILTGTAPAAEMLKGMVTGIGPFVRYLAMVSPKDRLVPGLLAMEPDGPFITEINRTQPGQPAAGTPWYVVSSDFEAGPLEDPDDPSRKGGQLALTLADRLADRLMGVKNDLVVDTASMASVDLPSGGGFIKDTLSFGTNATVYHLSYFIQPKTSDTLRSWLI